MGEEFLLTWIHLSLLRTFSTSAFTEIEFVLSKSHTFHSRWSRLRFILYHLFSINIGSLT